MNFNIIGAGTWGITFANLLKLNGHNVKVLHRNSLKTLSLIRNNIHPDLPKSVISNNIQYTNNFLDLEPNDITLLAIPSNSISEFLTVNDLSNFKIVVLSKGFDTKSELLISELLIKKFNYKEGNIAILSGPNHAEEIIKKNPTTSIIASVNKELREDLRNYFSNNFFRLYTSSDVVGVQIGGAVKNVIAIASGICDGIGFGDNSKNNTIYGLSGLGDLACTCYSSFSRNRRFGELLSKGNNVKESKESIGMVSEGINTSRVLYNIIKSNNLYMPICIEVYNIIYNNSTPKDSMLSLMNRALKDEK